MILFGGIFVVIFLVILLCVGLGQAFLVSQQKNQIRNMLKRADSVAIKRGPDFLKTEVQEDSLSKTLNNIKALDRVTALLEQSGLDWTLGNFVIFTTVAAIVGGFIGFILPPLSQSPISVAPVALITASLPLMIVLRKRSKRLAQFDEQFPEALNFLSRSMRAGHAFSIGLEMLVADSAEPLSSVFRLMLNDLHLGSTLESAMGKLVTSVPMIDVRFFVSAVLLQQGTGGNLSEILDSMAKIMRERFRLRGQIKAASAHGRVTGMILAVMPVIVAVIMFVVSPDYLLVLARDPDGKKLVIGACIAQLVGFFCIRKIVNIKV